MMISKSLHKNSCFTLLVILFWMLTPIGLFAQSQDVGFPYIKNYYPSEYKAHVQNFDVVQDNRGNMYFANFRGILEFDGQTWRTIQTSKISQVTSLAIDSEGTIFVGAAGEIGFLHPDLKGELLFSSLLDSLPQEVRQFKYISTILATKDGVYFVTDASILIWNKGSFKTIKGEGPINAAYYVNEKLFFFDKRNGLQYLQNNQKIKVQTGNQFSEAIVIKAMLPYGPNKELIATGINGLLVLDENGISNFRTSDDNYLKQNSVSCATNLKDGTICLGTERGGIVIFNPDGTLKQKIDQGIQNDYIRALYVDNNEVLWAALDNGISRIETPSSLSFFDSKRGVDGAVNQILRLNGNIYFATDKGLYHYEDTQKRYVAITGINSACWSLLSDKNSIIAATSRGIFLTNGSSTELLAPGFSFKIFQSSIHNSSIYVGQLDGITHLENVNGRWIFKGKIPGVTGEVSEIQEDQSGILWAVVATEGLVRINPNGNPVIYDETKGLPSRFGNHLSKIDGLLVVTTQNGLFSYDGTANTFASVKKLLNDTIMPKEWISAIIQDAKGNLWSTGGDQTNIQIRNENGKVEQSQLILNPVQDKTISTIYPELSGKVWFGGTDGAFSYDPEIPKNLTKIPKVLIRSFIIAGDSTLFGGSFVNKDNRISTTQPPPSIPVLDYSLNTVAFSFACPSFNMYESVHFQYFLKGFDKEPSLWITDIYKEYTNLPAGEYTFTVVAKNIYGQITAPATFQFVIKKPFYQTYAAYLLYLLFLVALIYVVVRIRSQKLIQEKKNLEHLILERTAEVVSQKEEIEKQSEELSNKNSELEKINLIVKSINSEIHFASLLQSLLEKTKVIGGVQKATMLVHDKATALFSYKAGFGWDVASVSAVHLTLNEVEDYYLSQANEVYEDIFEVMKINADSAHEGFLKVEDAKSTVIMVVRVKDMVEGFLILENMQKKSAFNSFDFSLLHNLKEHVISAFIKTIILEDLQTTLTNLKETQEQLIQQEKMASIGQLTKGIVDRILNPLNYINNFSLITRDLAVEIEEILSDSKEILSPDTFDDITDILGMVKSNVLKVNEHGTSASRIVKGMEKLLKERSRVFIATDLNTLIESHIEIALQEYTADNKLFKVDIKQELDAKSNKIKVLPVELGSVIVNTVLNSFYAVEEKMKKVPDFQPQVIVSTDFSDDVVKIIIHDNGNGIPAIEQKQLFSPFFTTKPTSKGTGLGLYMSMDIIKSHKGTIEVDSKDGEYAEFIIKIPKNEEIKNE
jgi:signal transduction histidine kinase/ligand-binding sensor domain-containing protein